MSKAEPQGHRRSNSFLGFLILGLALLLIFGGLGWYNYKSFFGGPEHLGTDSSNCLALNALITGRAKPLGYKNTGAILSYKYETGGKVYEQTEDVDESTYYINYERDSVRICCHRDAPEKSNIVSNNYGAVSQYKVVIVDLIMLVVVVIVAVQARRIGRKNEA